MAWNGIDPSLIGLRVSGLSQKLDEQQIDEQGREVEEVGDLKGENLDRRNRPRSGFVIETSFDEQSVWNTEKGVR